MSYEHNCSPLPHSADCGCRICMSYGPGLRERDIWRNPDHPGIIHLRRTLSEKEVYYTKRLGDKILELQKRGVKECEAVARYLLKEEGLEP